MERKKTFTLMFLSIIAVAIACQASATITHALNSVEVKDLNYDISNDPSIAPQPSLNAIFNWSDFNTSAQPSVWFYVNVVLVVAVPVLFIVQSIFLNRSKPKLASGKLEDQDDGLESEPKVANQIAPNEGVFVNFIRFGFFTIFIQNITILVLYVALLVTLPQSLSGDGTISLNILKIYSITYFIDFIGALLVFVGLILYAPHSKRKVLTYVGAGFWLGWIGLGIYPRINTISSIGLFGGTTGFEFANWALNFYGADLFLITAGSVSLAIAVYYTAIVLLDSNYIRGKGMINSFGIGNYIVTAGFTIPFLILLSFGDQLTGPALGSIGILWIVFIIGKFLISPVMGLIAGIVGFRQVKVEN